MYLTQRTAVHAAFLAALAVGSCVQAQTVAYWRFDEGVAGTDVLHATPDGVFDGTMFDYSGNGNNLSAWSQGGFAGYQYRADLTAAIIPGTGEPNLLSVKNTGGAPGMFTNSGFSLPVGVDIETMTPRAFTIEASFKPENGGHRTVVGRDGQFVRAGDDAHSTLYFQSRPDNSFAFIFVDVSGFVHEAATKPGYIHGFDYPSDPDGLQGTWYNAVGVSDGASMSLYINGSLIATVDIGASGSPDTSLAVGTASGGDWHAGGWSVGRGLYNGGHGDRAYGYIDEVRISNEALTADHFLFPIKITCPSDFNNDGSVNSQDFFDFLTAFFAAAPQADFNADGTVNSQDFFDFLTAFFAGC